MADAHLTPDDVNEIKEAVIAIVQSGDAPKDLLEHLKEMGVESPEDLMTMHLPEGHWEMMKEKWVIPFERNPHENKAETTPKEKEAGDAARMALPEGWQAPADRPMRLNGLEKAGDNYNFGQMCALHKEGCATENCQLCKMCSNYSQ